MSYLIPADYKRLIQADNLQQVIGADPTILDYAERTAIEEAQSVLKVKYELGAEFRQTPPWLSSSSYNAGDRVFLDAPVFSPTASYAAGDLVSYAVSSVTTNIYSALQDISPGAWDAAKWVLQCVQYQVFNAVLPAAPFDLYGKYVPGVRVFYKDAVYTCMQPSPGLLSHEQAIQYRTYGNIPYPNVYPDDAVGPQYWRSEGAYQVPAGTNINNPTYWIMGDNRSQQLVTYIVASALYWAHYRIAPRNIPDLRVKAYDDAKRWYKQCSVGEASPALPVKKPTTGGRIRFGGNVKNINSY